MELGAAVPKAWRDKRRRRAPHGVVSVRFDPEKKEVADADRTASNLLLKGYAQSTSRQQHRRDEA
jgi:hypothetical protein